MEVKDGNKLIAEFMGKEFLKGFLTKMRPAELIVEQLENSWGKFDSDWSWLMPVIEKISNYHYPEYYGSRGKSDDEGEWDDCAYPRTFGMRDKEGNYMVRLNANTLHHAPTLIEATWLAVVDFITQSPAKAGE